MKLRVLKFWNILLIIWANQAQVTSGYTRQYPIIRIGSLHQNKLNPR